MIVRTVPPFSPSRIAFGLPTSFNDLSMVNWPLHVPLIKSVESGSTLSIFCCRLPCTQLTVVTPEQGNPHRTSQNHSPHERGLSLALVRVSIARREPTRPYPSSAPPPE